MKIKNYKAINTYWEKEGLSFRNARDLNGRVYFLRLLHSEENMAEKWYDLYEHYQLTVTNYKHLPRVHSIDSIDSSRVFTTFSFEPGKPVAGHNHLDRDGVEQLLDAVAHLHAKGLVHGSIEPDNIWLTDEGKVILFGAGEAEVFGRKLGIQDDLHQLVEVLSDFSVLDRQSIRQLQTRSFQDIEDLRQQLPNSVSPGLVEKEKKAAGLPAESGKSPVRNADKELPPPVPSDRQEENPRPKRHVSRWVGAGIAAAVVLAGAVWGGIEIGGMQAEKKAVAADAQTSHAKTAKTNSNKSDKTNTSTSAAAKTAKTNSNAETVPKSNKTNSTAASGQPAPVKIEAPPFDQTALNQVAPGWQLERSQTIHFPQSDAIVAGVSSTGQNKKCKVVVAEFDKTSGKWRATWSGDLAGEYFAPSIDTVMVSEPDLQQRAIAIVTAEGDLNNQNIPEGEALALTIDQNGSSQLEDRVTADNLSARQQGNDFVVSGDQPFGMHELSLKGGQFSDSNAPLSPLASDGTFHALYKLWDDGYVAPDYQDPSQFVKTKVVTMKVGQTISFVPGDSDAQKNQGIIEIFTDKGRGTLDLSDANRVRPGSTYTFANPGSYQFLLTYDIQSFGGTIPGPTFIVNVQP